jgi:hypothetical protein
MKTYKFFIFVLLIVPISIQTQSYDVTIEQIIIGDKIDVSLYLKHTGTSSTVLGFCSFYINYNKDALTNPILQTDGQWDNTYNSGYAQNLINFNPSSGIASIEVVKDGSPTFQIPDVKTHLGTIRFTNTDQTKLSDISWNNSFTEVFDANSEPNNIKSNGSFINPGDFPLPVELVSFSDQVLPTRYRLYPAFPNPFNPSTNLRFDIPANEGNSVKTSLFIYNTLGQIVKTIYQGYSKTGSYEFQWLGDSEKGNNVPNGIYYVVLKTEKYQQSRKLILMK